MGRSMKYRECPDCHRILPYLLPKCDCGRTFTGGERRYLTCRYCGNLLPSGRIFCDCGRLLLFQGFARREVFTQADLNSEYQKGYVSGTEDERKRNSREWEQFFIDAQLKDTITGDPIRSLDDFRRWKVAFDRIKAEKAKKRETTYLLEGRDGFLVRVPESKLDEWLEAQSEPPKPLTEAEQRLKKKIVQRIYGNNDGGDYSQ